MREPVKFNGRPEELRLKYPTGRECSNGAFMYTLQEDDRVLFATPALNVKIQELRPYAGIRIAAQLLGNNRWDVKRVDPPASGPELVAPARQQAGNCTPGNGGSSHGSTREETLTKLGNVLVHGDPVGPRVAPASLMTGQSQFILQQVIAAIEATHAAEKYASAMGRPVTFSEESIRAFAISCFIQQTRSH